MKYAALTLLGAAFIFQLWFIFWMNSRVQPQPQPEQYPWLKKEVFRPAHYAPPAATKPSKVRPAATTAPAGPVRGEMAIGGLVLEQQGEPAEDVSILVEQRDISPPALLNAGGRPPRWQASTDAQGRFSFNTLGAGSFVVSAFSDGMHARSTCTLDEQTPAAELSLKLAPSTAVRGQVVAAEGPVANAYVYPLEAKGAATLDPARFYPARTDNAGQFELTDLQSGAWEMLVTAREHTPMLVEVPVGGPESVEIKLAPGASLQGKVAAAEDDIPVTGVTVLAEEAKFGIEQHQAKVNSQGEFVFKDLRPAEYHLSVDSPRWALACAPVPARPGQQGAGPVLTVERTGAVRGRVLSAEDADEGVGRVKVRALPREKGVKAREDSTDMGGYYLFPGLKAGEYEIALDLAPQLAPAAERAKPVTVVSNQRVDGPTFTVQGGREVVGAVINAEGKPAAAANVYLNLAEDGAPPKMARTDAKGSFTFSGVSNGGTITVWAEAGGLQSEAFGPAKVGAAGLRGVALKLALANTSGISGRIVNAQGRGVGDLIVACAPAAGEKLPILETRTDAQGQFAFEGLPAATYGLKLAQADEAAKTVTLKENERVTDLEVVMR